MPNIQTTVSREALALLHRQAIMGDKTLRDLLREIITNHLKEDESWQKTEQQQ